MFDRLCTWSNLLHAYRRASKGKRGLSYVARFEHRLEDNLAQLQEELGSGRYQPGPYQNFYIHEPKRRLISAAPFRDRVVHHALANMIDPLFERSFVTDSFANRTGKGNHRALARCQTLARRFRYVLPCDIRQYFPAIDHAILQNFLFAKLSDPMVRSLIELILASGRQVHQDDYRPGYFPGDDLWACLRPTGLPIGNLTSQLWANVYLNAFDHFIKRELRVPGYVRYVDDFLLFSESKSLLWDWKSAICDRLAQLRLRLHPGNHPRPTSEGISFLGFIVFPDRRRRKSRKGYHFRRKLRRRYGDFLGGELDFDDLQASIDGWVNHVRYGNTVGLRKAVFSDVFHVP